MANYVHTTIEISDNGDKELDLLHSLELKLEEHGEFPFHELFDDGQLDFVWYSDNVGSKNCYVEEVNKDDSYIRLRSAWCYPDTGVDRLVKECIGGGTVTIRYEDEMPNFIGAVLYRNAEIVDQKEWDHEDIDEELAKRNDEYHDLLEEYKSSYGDRKDELEYELQECRSEEMWELIGEVQDTFLLSL